MVIVRCFVFLMSHFYGLIWVFVLCVWDVLLCGFGVLVVFWCGGGVVGLLVGMLIHAFVDLLHLII